VLLPLGFLWFVLINQLRVEWLVNPQYSYGWVVPFLCLAFLLQRWLTFPGASLQKPDAGGQKSLILLFSLMALLYLPTRLVQEANPEWRIISWALAIEVVALTLIFVNLALGDAGARWFAFPICFFLVAVPWPTIIEGPVIQTLTRVNSAAVVELLSWTGIPAVQHGNLIEVSTGTVGVDEACSGIRSFQTSLMISLFFGEFYAMGLWRRWLLIPAGFVLAMAFNVCRMLFLTTIAAKKGVPAIATYHDPAGILVALVCSAGLWGLAMLFKKKLNAETLKIEIGGQKAEGRRQRAEVGGQRPEVRDQISAFQFSKFQRFNFTGLFGLSIALLVWLALVEVGVESWYRWHEVRLPKSASWSMAWPRSNPTFSESPLTPKTKQLLRYDEAGSGAWRADDGTQWQMIYLRWLPGRIAVHLAKSHTPDVCLPAAGRSVQANPALEYLPVHGLRLPFRTYTMEETGRTSYVFYCLWEDRAWDQFFQRKDLEDYGNRLNPALEGRRNVGQRSLEVIISGYADLDQAKAALVQQLQTVIRVEMPAGKS
jgi:exosortase